METQGNRTEKKQGRTAYYIKSILAWFLIIASISDIVVLIITNGEGGELIIPLLWLCLGTFLVFQPRNKRG
jgi:hypothetical protein